MSLCQFSKFKIKSCQKQKKALENKSCKFKFRAFAKRDYYMKCIKRFPYYAMVHAIRNLIITLGNTRRKLLINKRKYWVK